MDTAQGVRREKALEKAPGDPARVKLFSLIVASESGEMSVCDLTDPVGLAQPIGS